MSTMSDIAKAAGVSTATVSRAISTPELVSEDTRARVQAAVERLGYRPNSAARSLRTQKSTAVLVIVPEIGNPFFATIIHGIEQIALERGYTVLLGNTENDPVRERAYLEMIDARRADGLILLNGQLLRRTAGAPLPIAADLPPLVFACEYLPGTDWPTVRVDNASGARLAVQHLLDLGHRRIGMITGPLWNILTRDRLQGFRDTLNDAGLPWDESLIIPGDFSLESGAVAGEKLLARADRPSAVFCANDEMAMGLIKAASQLGLRVPTDLSVVGFDDLKFAEHWIPALTTVAQPMLDIGRTAMEMLCDLLDETAPPRNNSILKTKLIVRASTGPPPANLR